MIGSLAELGQAGKEWESWGAVVVELRKLGVDVNQAKPLVLALKRWSEENAALRILQDPAKFAEWLMETRLKYPYVGQLQGAKREWELVRG